MGSMADDDMLQVTSELELDGRPLDAPRILGASEMTGGRLAMEVAPLAPAAFIATKDPRVQQKKTWVEDIVLPRYASCIHLGAQLGTSFARIVHGVLEPNECAELVAQANDVGYTPLENRYRCMLDCPEMASYLLEVMRPHLPERLCCGRECLEELNDRFRFSFYLPGQEFEPHCDPFYSFPHGHPKHGQTSRVTVLFYLHDVPEANGGATTFVGDGQVTCQPRGGSALIFTQDLRHEGSMVNSGIKYFIRTELMYVEDRQAKELDELIDSI